MFFIHTYTKLRKKRDLIVTELRDTVIQSLETADLLWDTKIHIHRRHPVKLWSCLHGRLD
jgi:hypothetical protein